MIPVKLIIEGLYSYQTRQTIDFEELMAAGLFGIFGAVGSGKSSILEAITFALYGKTERLNESGDARNYNMMNLRSNKSCIDFEFLNHEHKKYRIVRSYRRNSKKYEDVKPADTVLYLWEHENWTPQASTDVSDIIGLTYQNFKRTIIIPQGQFKEFLDLGATERTKMLKEIFGLQRFDLQKKTAEHYAETQRNLDNLNGQLLGFEAINENEIDALKQHLSTEMLAGKALEARFAAAKEALNNLKMLKADFESLQQQQSDFLILEDQKASKEALEHRCNIYDKINLSFAALLAHQTKTQNELEKKQLEKASALETLVQLQSKAAGLQSEIATLLPDYQQLGQRRNEETDLMLIYQIAELKNEVSIFLERLQKGAPLVEQSKEKAEALELQLEKIQKDLDAIKASKPNAALLLSIENWFGKKENIEQQIEGAHSRIVPIQENLKALYVELKQLAAEEKDYQLMFQQREEKITAQLEALRLQESSIKVQEQLSQFAHALHEGEACPLCGAEEHPNVLTVADLSQEYAHILAAIDIQNKALKTLAEEKATVEQIIFKTNSFNQQIAEIEKEINSNKTALEAHFRDFTWQGFDADNKRAFELQKESLTTIENQIAAGEAALATTNTALKKEHTNIETYKKALDEFKIAVAQKEAQIDQNKRNLKQLQYEDYSAQNTTEIAAALQLLQAKNDALQSEFESKTKSLNELQPQIATQENQQATIQSRMEELKAEATQQTLTITQLLQEHELENTDAVKAILAAALDTQKIRAALQEFKVQYATLEQNIARLKEKTKGQFFSPENYTIQEENVTALQQEHTHFTEKTAQLRAEIQRQESEFNKKKELLLVQEQLEKRFQNLGQLKRLFDRAGFVEYVSSIYLRQLCDMANVRFHRLTRNQLSLQLNDDNDFEVIDYLNEGKRRSVKTLSGGQAFQVSLSLALALAESVQSNAKADKNFFFIDEGFGTQDAASVNIVFETLMNLQKENRIVGIISHVDELKDKIPVSLSITKDEEHGSIISAT